MTLLGVVGTMVLAVGALVVLIMETVVVTLAVEAAGLADMEKVISKGEGEVAVAGSVQQDEMLFPTEIE